MEIQRSSQNNDQLMDIMRQASSLLYNFSEPFKEKICAPRFVDKGGHDFATEQDLFLEKEISRMLVEQTGIRVYGEEFGGEDFPTGTTWVLDPIDGTANYSAGLPLAGILLSLIQDGIPVIGICYMPIFDQMMTATIDSALYINAVPQPQLVPRNIEGDLVGFGSFRSGDGGEFPGDWRIDVLSSISKSTSRLRVLGSTGLTSAYVASGTFAAAINYGSHIWDNAGGKVLVEAAGGIVSDLYGNPWSFSSEGMLIGAPGAYEQVLEIISPHVAQLSDPSSDK